MSGLAISANDSDALVPTGREAMDSGIPVVTWDSAIAPGGRNVHIVQAESDGIAAVQVQMAFDLAGGAGQIAILSATSKAPNQNEWIALMQEELQKPEYANLELVSIVYGDDEDEKSYNEAVGLMQTYPDLKVIIAPTTVGIATSARAVQDAGRIGEVFVTGLGTPNQMREYVNTGTAPQFALWNPGDLGYLAIHALHAIASGAISGQPGDSFDAGKLAYREVLEQVQAVSKQPVSALHIVGGGSQNRLLNQMAAKATGLPVVAGPVEATVIGNALVQLISLGEIANLAQARQIVADMAELQTYEPESGAGPVTAVWREAYNRYQNL